MASNPRNLRKPPDQWNPTWRSVVSVLLVMHFFCVFVVLTSNTNRSPLQTRLVQVFAIYTQLMNFDPNFTPYELTMGEPSDDAVIALDLYADGEKAVSQQPLLKTVTLPDRGSKLLDSQKRYLSIGRIIAEGADPQLPQDDITGELAGAIGGRIMRENGARRCVFRCLRRTSQPMNLDDVLPQFPRDNPADPRYDIPIYEADVWFDEDDRVQVIKRSAQNEVAPRQGGS